mgnify:CR=1 FL=1
MYLGNYYIKEITPPAGYLLDETEHDVVCDAEGDTVAIVKRSCNVKEQVKKQPFQLIKAGNNGNTDAELLKGAGFQALIWNLYLKKKKMEAMILLLQLP